MDIARGLPAIIAVFALLLATPVGAEDGEKADSDVLAVSRPQLSYEEYRRTELEYLAKRSRKALIATSAAAAVGIALVTPAAVNECVRIASSASFDDLRCTQTGRVLLGIGVPTLAAGATGMLVTAIMLGVRRGRIKFIEERLRFEQSQALSWDPARSALVF